MNKEDISGYRASQCCRTCKYRTERMHMTCGDTDIPEEAWEKWNKRSGDYGYFNSAIIAANKLQTWNKTWYDWQNLGEKEEEKK